MTTRQKGRIEAAADEGDNANCRLPVPMRVVAFLTGKIVQFPQGSLFSVSPGRIAAWISLQFVFTPNAAQRSLNRARCSARSNAEIVFPAGVMELACSYLSSVGSRAEQRGVCPPPDTIPSRPRLCQACRLTFFTDKGRRRVRSNGAFVRDAISEAGVIDEAEPALCRTVSGLFQ